MPPPAYTILLASQADLPSGLTALAPPPEGFRFVVRYIHLQLPSFSGPIEWACSSSVDNVPFAGGVAPISIDNQYIAQTLHAVINSPYSFQIYVGVAGANLHVTGYQLSTT